MEYFVLGWGNSFFFGVVFLGCEHIFSLGRNIFEEGVDNGVDSSYNIFCDYGMWHSLVARIVRDDEAAGSNPVIPTIECSSRQLWLAAFCLHREGEICGIRCWFTSYMGRGEFFRLRRSAKWPPRLFLRAKVVRRLTRRSDIGSPCWISLSASPAGGRFASAGEKSHPFPRYCLFLSVLGRALLRSHCF